jgi:Asp-tRNA(Asn)/Glu-tRNA(Gln) amidotransferase C subunit
MDIKEVEKIREEARVLLEKFSKALECVDSGIESNVERPNDRRKDGEGVVCDENFRKILLENAPAHDDNFIIAEKKTW